MREQTRSYNRFVLLVTVVLTTVIYSSAQNTHPVQDYPTHLPYNFSNFVWWSNDELRDLLKKRIPGLGDEIAPSVHDENRIREALRKLLKGKGIDAEVQSIEPSNFSLSAERAPGAPEPAIVFSILSPQILIDKVFISQAPDDLRTALNENLQRRAGHEYSGGQDWLVRSNAKDELESKGYLEAEVDVAHDAPRRDGDHYLVNLVVSVKSGPQYHISSITADGGPLYQGGIYRSFFYKRLGRSQTLVHLEDWQESYEHIIGITGMRMFRFMVRRF